jgi:hypothetical protein
MTSQHWIVSTCMFCILAVSSSTTLAEDHAKRSNAQNTGMLFIYDHHLAYELPVTEKDQREQKCAGSKSTVWGQSLKRGKTITERELQTEKITFYSYKPQRTLMGIRSAKIEENILIVDLVNKDKFEEYEAPVVYTVDKTSWAGSPYNALMVNLIGAGMPLLMNPKETLGDLFGCVDEKIIKKELDLTNKSKTSKFVWANGTSKNQIQIQGFDKEYFFEAPQSMNDFNFGEVRIDLGEAIANSNLNTATKLIVLCGTCEISNIDDQKEFQTLKSSVELSSDFRMIRSAEIQKLRQKEESTQTQLKFQQPQRLANAKTQSKEKSLPPNLTFNSSAQKIDGSIDLSGRVTSSAIISEITINGRVLEIPLGKDGSFRVARVPSMGIVTNYKLSVVDEYGQRSTAEVNVERKATQYTELFSPLDSHKMKAKTNPNAVALIIGVETYLSLPKAQYADSDASHFYDYVHQALGTPTNKIKLLTDTKASRVELLKVMRNWMKTEIVEGKSDVYIFFAGHGLSSPDGNKTYLLPSDGDRDLLDETSILRDDLIASAKGAKTITMFLDTCYSGGTRTNEVLLADARPIAIVPDMKSLPSNVTVLAAASGAQLSSTYEAAQQGLFSYWLMKGLEGVADTNKDKKITAGELHEFVVKQVGPMAQRRNRQQDPQLMGDGTRVLVSY